MKKLFSPFFIGLQLLCQIASLHAEAHASHETISFHRKPAGDFLRSSERDSIPTQLRAWYTKSCPIIIEANSSNTIQQGKAGSVQEALPEYLLVDSPLVQARMNVRSLGREILINEDFENGNLSHWIDTADWVVSSLYPLSGTYSLMHNSSGSASRADTSMVCIKVDSTNLDEDTICWRFIMKNGNWDPSSSNKFWVCLASSSSNLLQNNGNSFVAGVNFSGSTDYLTLWKKSSLVTPLIPSILDWNENMKVAVEITRFPEGLWQMKYSENGSFNQLKMAGEHKDTSFFPFNYAGMVYVYTSSRARQLWIDGFYIGKPIIDCEKPLIVSCNPYGNAKLMLQFNESIELTSITNFLLNDSLVPIDFSIDSSDHSRIILTFGDHLTENAHDKIFLKGIADESGNAMNDTSMMFPFYRIKTLKARAISSNEVEVLFSKAPDHKSAINRNNYFIQNMGLPDTVYSDRVNACKYIIHFTSVFTEREMEHLSVKNIEDSLKITIDSAFFEFQWYKHQFGDIVINEIMADPDPSIGLPMFEYVELYNKTDYDVELSGWKLVTGSSSRVFPYAVLEKHSYLLLAGDSAKKALSTITTIGLGSFTNAIANSGQNLQLRNATGELIHFVTFDDSWYHSDYKSSGGWSLEMIDPFNICGEGDNWTASMNKSGGTPGFENSVYEKNPDQTVPFLQRAAVLNDSTLKIWFSESVLPQFLQNTHNYKVSELSIYPDYASIGDSAYTSACLIFKPIFEHKKLYTLSIPSKICDCVGNTSIDGLSVIFGLPEPSDSGDMVINEILFDPLAGCPEYFELYNKTNKVIELSNYLLCKRDEVTKEPYSCIHLTKENFQFKPEQYLLLTYNYEKLLEYFYVPPSAEYVTLSEEPAFPDDKGDIMLMSKQMKVIDELIYDKSMQFGLISDPKGVSLERTCFNCSSLDKGNWHSSAQTNGFGTPGYKNSQFAQNDSAKETISIDPEVFSPDNDGFQDQLIVSYKFDRSGKIVTVRIFDARGKLVRSLVQNEYIGNSASYRWDGESDAGVVAPAGIYLIFSEVYDASGNLKQYKNTCVLAKKLE
jgi:hypothetical protein